MGRRAGPRGAGEGDASDITGPFHEHEIAGPLKALARGTARRGRIVQDTAASPAARMSTINRGEFWPRPAISGPGPRGLPDASSDEAVTAERRRIGLLAWQ